LRRLEGDVRPIDFAKSNSEEKKRKGNSEQLNLVACKHNRGD
jgi:hypothetical protein